MKITSTNIHEIYSMSTEKLYENRSANCYTKFVCYDNEEVKYQNVYASWLRKIVLNFLVINNFNDTENIKKYQEFYRWYSDIW